LPAGFKVLQFIPPFIVAHGEVALLLPELVSSEYQPGYDLGNIPLIFERSLMYSYIFFSCM
jgi:hypothetical protein